MPLAAASKARQTRQAIWIWLFWCQPYAPPLQLWELASQLADVVGCPVDLLDLRAASTVMQHQVIMQGTRLFARSPGAGLFECFVLSEKTALDAARAGVLGDIARQGKVYGG